MPACTRNKQHVNNPGHSPPNKLLQLRAHLSHGVGPKLQAALGMALASEAESNRFVKFVGVHRRVCVAVGMKLLQDDFSHLPELNFNA